jgi:hypothetical protein
VAEGDGPEFSPSTEKKKKSLQDEFNQNTLYVYMGVSQQNPFV